MTERWHRMSNLLNIQANIKLHTITCNVCRKYGHWYSQKNYDVTLPPDVNYVEHSSASQNSNSSQTSNSSQNVSYTKITVCFNTATLEDSAHSICSTGHTHCKYVNGNHYSSKRLILGSTVLTTTSDSWCTVQVTLLVLYVSSQWVIGRNITLQANLWKIVNNTITFLVDGEPHSISLTDYEFLSYTFNIYKDWRWWTCNLMPQCKKIERKAVVRGSPHAWQSTKTCKQSYKLHFLSTIAGKNTFVMKF